MGLFEFLVLCLIGCVIYLALEKKVKHRDKTDYGDDDTRTIQEIHRGLQRMEDRIESLETILMDHPRTRSHHAHSDSDY
jgi:phage shock protein B